jgi:hypothetical protein
MIIPVNEHYRIATDPNQWMVEKARTRNGKKDWESKFFYPTFESALRGIGELMVRRSDAETLADAIGDVEMVSTTLSQALTIRIEGLEEAQSQDQDDE